MLKPFREKLPEVLRSILPLIGVVCLLQFAVVDAPAAQFVRFLLGSVVATFGLLLLFVGIDLGILPMGRFIGAELPRKRSLLLIIAVAAALGFATTVAEPDVLVLAEQVEAASGGAVSGQPLAYVIAAGVGLFAAVALLRMIWGVPMTWVLAAVYALMILLSLSAPAEYLALAYDGGSVTTGVLSAPVLLALALGLSAVLSGRTPASDGFGLLGLASAGAVIVVLVLGRLAP
jgi:hypothetical protein